LAGSSGCRCRSAGVFRLQNAGRDADCGCHTPGDTGHSGRRDPGAVSSRRRC
jgi:hypothetical protein